MSSRLLLLSVVGFVYRIPGKDMGMGLLGGSWRRLMGTIRGGISMSRINVKMFL